MSQTRTSRIQDKLAPHADELAAAAEAADDQAEADLAIVLAALARGEEPPRDAARRVANRIRSQ